MMQQKSSVSQHSRLTEVFLDCVGLVHGHDPRAQDGEQGNVVRQDAKAAAERRHIHLLHVGSLVVYLHGGNKINDKK